MSFLRRNGLVLRGLAVALTAYCVLASGRALIPGLCATLADANARVAASCHAPKHSCCDTPGQEAVHLSSPAHTAAQPIALETIQRFAAHTPLSAVSHEVYVADFAAAGHFLRAPPLA